ncbi:MAG: putative ABC transporter permease [Ruminococcus bromii]|nr:putative ABC transporter permease [Ruminococcus bromii]
MKKNSLLFLVGSCAYPTLEMLWRGYTHSSMALAGGVCMVLINKICCERMQKKSLTARCAAGSAIITGVEFVFGLVVNRMLHLHVWDYSALPMNILGQICIPFSLIWFFLTIPASALCRLCSKAADRFMPESEASEEQPVTAR